MPANLPPVYHDAEERYRAATTPEAKIAALQEMLSLLPRHKGTDKLLADLRARIAKLRKQPARKGAARAFTRHLPREGAGQIALVGPPNSGKSTLVAGLTHARPEVADYPYTTREPTPGMMPFEDIAFQLVDLPPLGAEHVEPWVFDLVRAADLLWVVVDEANSLDGLQTAQRLLAARKIAAHPAGAPPAGRSPGWTFLPALLVVTGRDHPGSDEDLAILQELLPEPWPIVPVSVPAGRGIQALKRRTFEALGILRVYSKQPGKPADRSQPFTLPRGSTIGDLARLIHNEIHDQMRFARIWGASAFDGQTVQRDHPLTDGDVVEIHA
jgi:hypothetical protein